MAVLIPGIPGRPGMRYTVSDWWKKKSANNVLYTRVVVNLLSTVMTMKNNETMQAKEL